LAEAANFAHRLGVETHSLGAATDTEFAQAYEDATRWHADAMLILTSPASVVAEKHLAELAIRHHLPTMHGFSEYPAVGGLMSYAANVPDLYRRAATYVDKILRGASPADLPIEQPTTFELVINLKTARALGLTIAPSLLARADRVIE